MSNYPYPQNPPTGPMPQAFSPLAQPFTMPSPAFSPAPPSGRRAPHRRRLVIIAICVLAVAGLAIGIVALTGGFSPGKFTMTGSITIIDNDTFASGIQTDGDSCQGTGGYSDLSPGTAVIVQDNTGQVIATGELEPGISAGDGLCLLPFSVPNVPDGMPNYSVTVSHRGTRVVASAEAHSGVLLSIGT